MLESGRTTGLLFTREGMPWDRDMLDSIIEVEGLTDGGVKPTENMEADTDGSLFGSWLTDDSVANALDEVGTDIDVDAPEV